MSNRPESNNFFEEFLEDYFAECEEHLTVVRRQLLALEPFVEQPEIERSILNELFRSFHSLKGLSGMVGVKDAEQLAHEMESYLRVLRDRQVMLSPEGFDALLSGTKVLEQAIAARRSENSPPEIDDAIAQLIAVMPEEASAKKPAIITPVQLELQTEEIQKLRKQLATGAQGWHFIFSPNVQLAEKGINVNKIRERLQAIGNLIRATPRMIKEGSIVFDFVMTSTVEPTTFAGWENEGLTWMPYPSAEAGEVREVQEVQELKEVEAIASSAPQPPTTPAPLITQPSNVVRVDLPKLDELMRMVGELVIARAKLQENLTQLKPHVPSAELRALLEINQTLERQLRDLREGIMRVRLVPIGDIFARMQFVVRDLVRETQKQVQLELSGEETEIDKFVVERMMDPLLHLVRNAVSHGIESRSERLAAGKPAEAKITLRAKTAGEMVAIEIEDDGQGIDIEKVLQRGRAQGLLPENDWGSTRERGYDAIAILEILCSPGFSTREQADLTSGRGVGMAIVKNTVHELGGLLTFETQKGKGTRFIIELPLTLAIADALIVSVAGQIFAIPQSSVREVIEVAPTAVTVFENNEIISYRNSVLPLLRLAQIFSLNNSQAGNSRTGVAARAIHNTILESPESPAKTHSLPTLGHVVVVGGGLSSVGIGVDRIIGQREIVVRALTDPFVQVPGISGATELGDGRVVLILDIASLIRKAMKLTI